MNGAEKERLPLNTDIPDSPEDLENSDEAEDAGEAGLSAAEQARFQRMMEDAEQQIAALDKWLSESGLIKKPEPPEQPDEDMAETAGEPEQPDESPGEATAEISAGMPPEKTLGKRPGRSPENLSENFSEDSWGQAWAEWPEKAAAGEDRRPDEDETAPNDEPLSEQAQRRRLLKKRISEKGAAASWQLLLGFGISFAVRIGFLGIWLGSYIDRRWLGDTGFGALAIIVLVIVYSFYMLYHDLMRVSTPEDVDDAEDDAENANNKADELPGGENQ